MSALRKSHNLGNTNLIFVLILASIGGVGYYAWSMLQSAIEPEEVLNFQFSEAKRELFTHSIRETGDIESAQNEEIKCEVRSPGGVEIISVVDEGVVVQEGDLLVELDTSTLEDQQQAQQVLVNGAESTKTSASAALRQAEISKQEYTDGTFKTNEQVEESNILIAKQQLSQAQDKSAFSERLAAKGFVTQQQLSGDRFAVQRAQLDLALYETRLKTLREITREKMLVGFDADIETRKAALEAATKNYDEELKKLEEINDMIKKCTIMAPKAGTVVHANYQYGDQSFTVEPGETVRERQTIIRLPDLDQLQVKTPIAEGKIASVREGLPVKIKVGALEDREFEGTVTSINRYAERQHWSQKVKRFATFIKIEGDSEGARVGLSADVEITVSQQPDKLQIPVQCLHEDNGQQFVLVRVPYDANNPLHNEAYGRKLGEEGEEFSVEARMIEYEASNDKVLVVTDDSGIKKGDQVVQNPRDNSDFLRNLVSHHRARVAMKRFSPDKNEYGRLTKADIERMNLELGYEGISNMGSADSNEDSAIDIQELTAFITKTQDLLIPLEDQSVIEANGQQAPETKEEKEARYKKQAEEGATKVLDNLDKNDDDVIDADELTKAGGFAEFLKLGDTNKDGSISKDELIAGGIKKAKDDEAKAAAGDKKSAGGGGRPGGGRPGGGRPGGGGAK